MRHGNIFAAIRNIYFFLIMIADLSTTTTAEYEASALLYRLCAASVDVLNRSFLSESVTAEPFLNFEPLGMYLSELVIHIAILRKKD